MDWQKICLDIRRDYKSLYSIESEVGSGWQHLNRLARGEVKEPKYSVGCKLLELHAQHCESKNV